ncbi:MAG TPA: DUF3465 domain-containing protein [Candidatus Angelobacter sp.]|jgi:hypothetical protein|nr:DUF3465 domain-containing protein [Candidatus Angelobacter sp.]
MHVVALRGLVVGLLCAVVVACGDPQVDNGAVASAIAAAQTVEVTVQGRVVATLSDGNGTDGPHQRFRVDLGGGVLVEIDHNLTLAPRVPLHDGDTVTVHGEFAPDPGHPVIHYTHHATGRHEGGWITLNGQQYS